MSRLYLVTLLFNFYAEYIMRNAGLEEAQAGIKISRRNINNLRYADDTTLMTEYEADERAKALISELMCLKLHNKWEYRALNPP